MTEGEMIAIAVAAVPDYYKERGFRYMRKILPSLLPKPRYTELLKAQAEQRLLSVDESRSLNVYKVCQRAGEILGEEDSNTPTVTDNPYEDDWLSTFENETCHKSSEDMQERFARMLAGEIKSPGTFSIRAIKLLGQIDSGTASIFRYFCSGCVSFDSPSGYGGSYCEETRRKISEAHKGKKLSEEARRKMSEAHKGEKHNNYGKPLSEETRRKISEAQETPERTAARDLFFSLPPDMALKEKRRLLRQKITGVHGRTIHRWVYEWTKVSEVHRLSEI